MSDVNPQPEANPSKRLVAQVSRFLGNGLRPNDSAKQRSVTLSVLEMRENFCLFNGSSPALPEDIYFHLTVTCNRLTGKLRTWVYEREYGNRRKFTVKQRVCEIGLQSILKLDRRFEDAGKSTLPRTWIPLSFAANPKANRPPFRPRTLSTDRRHPPSASPFLIYLAALRALFPYSS